MWDGAARRIQAQSHSGNVLAKELETWQGNNLSVTFLQYVDDLLIGSKGGVSKSNH